MGLPHQGCEHAECSKSVVIQDRRNPTWCGRAAMLAALFAATMTFPLQANALEAPGMTRLTEQDLSRVAARGLSDRLFERISRFSYHGLAVEVLGDMATLLNPLDILLDADTTFKDTVFNPTSPWMVVDSNGTAYVRLPPTIGEIDIRNIRIPGSKGTTFGSVTIRNLNTNGTTITIRRH